MDVGSCVSIDDNRKLGSQLAFRRFALIGYSFDWRFCENPDASLERAKCRHTSNHSRACS